jgi:hypothetical protein
MWVERGLFALNGGCGYVLKPPFMRAGWAYSPSAHSRVRSLRVRLLHYVLIGLARDGVKVDEPLLSLSIHGVPADCAEQRRACGRRTRCLPPTLPATRAACRARCLPPTLSRAGKLPRLPASRADETPPRCDAAPAAAAVAAVATLAGASQQDIAPGVSAGGSPAPLQSAASATLAAPVSADYSFSLTASVRHASAARRGSAGTPSAHAAARLGGPGVCAPAVLGRRGRQPHCALFAARGDDPQRLPRRARRGGTRGRTRARGERSRGASQPTRVRVQVPLFDGRQRRLEMCRLFVLVDASKDR